MILYPLKKMSNLWQKQTVFHAVMMQNTSRLWKIAWISFILIIIIEVILLMHTSHHLKLNASWQVKLPGNTLNPTLQTESYHPQIPDNTSELIEEKDEIMDLFEDIEISVLCDIFQDVNSSNKMNPRNITVSEKTLYARVRLRIEQGECTNQTVFTKWVNYSIGIGVNKLRYTLVPDDYKWLNITGMSTVVEHIINYTSYHHVYSVRFNVARFLSLYHGDKQLLKVCIFEQNCLHWIDRSRHCGLQDISDVTNPELHFLTSNWSRSGGWIAFLEYINSLCDTNIQGHGLMNNNNLLVTHSAWFVPCIRCNSHPDEEANCDWSSALWFEANNPIYPCIYSERRMHSDQRQLSAYLKNKVLLFFGDSTLRGLMYSLVYRLNKTLFNVQETHGEIILTNNGAKLIRFIYYPDYSRQEQQSSRSLITDLIQSLFRFKGKFNEALLFFGGVRWLNSFHMKQLQIAVNKEKIFQSVKVFIKDYSAGFHTPIDGLPFVDWTERKMEHERNYRLIKTIKEEYNWSVIPSHQITWTRLNHFHAYARCSCHFYHIERKPFHSSTENKNITIYEIIGQIHWIVSRIIEMTILQNSP